MAASVKRELRDLGAQPDPAVRPFFRVTRSYRKYVSDGAWLRRANLIWLVVALWTALGVRVFTLTSQSLWNDEGNSVALALRSFDAIASASAQDIHPPLYYFLLKLWISVAGTSEFSLRFLSVLASVALIAVTFRIARELFDQDVAMLAVMLSALNAFQVYYAQEARMYMWVALWSALSVWALVRIVLDAAAIKPLAARARVLFWILYGASALAALYTQYYAFTILVFENIAFLGGLIWFVRDRPRELVRVFGIWVAVQLAIAVLFVPWLNFARNSLLSWPAISASLNLWELARNILSAFALAIDQPLQAQWFLLAAYAIFFVGGLLPSRDLLRQSPYGIFVVALWALLPFFAMYVVSLSRPSYNPKFLLLATPGFLILVARGLSVLYPGLFLRERYPGLMPEWSKGKKFAMRGLQALKMLVAGTLAAGLILSLGSLWNDPRLQRDDYRGIVRYINALATEKDAVIVDAPGQMDVVRYYYRGAAELRSLPVGRPLLRDQTRAAIADVLKTHDKLFAIYWATEQADPERFVERSLSEVSYKASDVWHGNVRLAEYAVSLLPPSFQARIPFGDEIFLRRFSIQDKAYAGGDIIPLELVWVATNPPRTNYKVFVHLVNAQGKLVAQHDDEPQNGFSPTSHWQEAQEISDKVGIALPVGLPPGEYSIVTGLYRGDTGERLKLKDGSDALTLGSLTISKRIALPDALLLKAESDAVFDSIRALGYNLTRNAEEATVYTRGEFIPLVVYWQARAKPSKDLDVWVQLRDQGGNVISSARISENYPTSRWDENEIVRDVINLAVPQNSLTGEYKIVLSDGTSSFDLTKVTVR